jgi:hypothetical protein
MHNGFYNVGFAKDAFKEFNKEFLFSIISLEFTFPLRSSHEKNFCRGITQLFHMSRIGLGVLFTPIRALYKFLVGNLLP